MIYEEHDEGSTEINVYIVRDGLKIYFTEAEKNQLKGYQEKVVEDIKEEPTLKKVVIDPEVIKIANEFSYLGGRFGEEEAMDLMYLICNKKDKDKNSIDEWKEAKNWLESHTGFLTTK